MEVIEESVTKDYLVYLETYDNYPQRLRLRMMADRNLDGLLWQIERQLDSDAGANGSSQLTFPLEHDNCEVFVCDPRDGALVPYGNATFDTLKATNKVLIMPRRSVPLALPGSAAARQNLGDLVPSGSSGDVAVAHETVRALLQKVTAALHASPNSNACELSKAVVSELDGFEASGEKVDDVVLTAFKEAFASTARHSDVDV